MGGFWARSDTRPVARADRPSDFVSPGSGLAVREIRPSNLFGYWKLLRCVNEKPASAPV